MREKLEKSFIATDELEDKQLKILGWRGPKAALKAVKQAAKAFERGTSLAVITQPTITPNRD